MLPAGACQNVNILIAHNSSTGIQILLTSATSKSNSTPNKLIGLPNHYLPPECGDNNHRCGILQFEYSGISYYIIPSTGGFVVLSHSDNYTGHADEVQISFINITEQCNPIKAFYAGPEGHHHIVIACMDLQTRPRGIIYYLQYYFNVERGSVIKNAELLTRSEPIYNPETVSEIIYVRGQQRCAEYDNLYFIDDAYVLHYPSDAFDPEFILSNQAIQNCNGHQSIEYYGNDSLLIRCSGSHTVLYDSCASQFTYLAPEHVPYPCTNWDTIIYRNGSKLTLNRHGREPQVALKLPFNDLSYGRCVQGVNRPTFIAISADGSIFIAPFDSSNFTKIASGNCTSSDNICPRPVFSENQQVFGAFDPTTDTLIIVNLTQACRQQPIVKNIHISFTPELISISLGKGTFNCSCPEILNLPRDAQGISETTEPHLTTPELNLTTQGISEEEDITAEPSTSLEYLIPVGVTILIFVVVAMVMVVIIAVLIM